MNKIGGCGWKCQFCEWVCDTADKHKKSFGGREPHCNQYYEFLDNVDREIFEYAMHSI